MSPRKPTIDGLDDVDDEDGILEEEVNRPNDLSLEVRRADEVGLGGAPAGDDDDTTSDDSASDDSASDDSASDDSASDDTASEDTASEDTASDDPDGDQENER